MRGLVTFGLGVIVGGFLGMVGMAIAFVSRDEAPDEREVP